MCSIIVEGQIKPLPYQSESSNDIRYRRVRGQSKSAGPAQPEEYRLLDFPKSADQALRVFFKSAVPAWVA